MLIKIGIITDSLDSPSTGIGNYTYNITKNIIQLNKDHEIVLIHGKKSLYKEYSDDTFKSVENLMVEYPRFPHKFFGKFYRKYKKMPIAIAKEKFDLIHETSQLRPIQIKDRPTRFVVTIHDIIPYTFPDYFKGVSISQKIYYMANLRMLKKVLEKKPFIIANSETTKNSMLEFFNFDSSRIKVIHYGCDTYYRTIEIEPHLRKKMNLDFPFILYVGTLESRKNVSSLVKAYARCKKGGINHKLVITSGDVSEEISRLIKKLDLEKEVIFTKFAGREELLYFYNAADLFVFPSLTEGFGLPVLEAMACGTPVLVSNVSSLPEIVGNAGAVVDPNNVAAISNKIRELLSNDEVLSEMSKKGVQRAKEFSWENAAKTTLNVYRDLE